MPAPNCSCPFGSYWAFDPIYNTYKAETLIHMYLLMSITTLKP